MISDQPNILFVVREHSSASSFDIKTNKFVGRKAENPSQMILVDRYLASEQRFQFGKSLFADKLNNLQGREVIIAGFDYPPYTVIKHVSLISMFSNLNYISHPSYHYFHFVIDNHKSSKVF